MVDSWKVIKTVDDPVLAAKATDIAELELVVKNLNEIQASGGYAKWKNLLTSFKNVDEIKHLLKTENSSAFFWSGRTSKGIGVQQDAVRIAGSKGGTTLEMLLEKRNIKLPDWDASNPAVVKVWEDVSAEYAKQVSGEVRAVLGKQLREGNVWQTKELPALMENANVKKIITIDAETLVETVIFTR